jgi:signal transduction histidine kinase
MPDGGVIRYQASHFEPDPAYLACHVEARPGQFVRLRVQDNGPGVPAELRQRIFEPFFTTKPVGEGTGLGLDIAWRIVVKKHHGDLRVESVPGDTRFQVRLPIQPENSENS